MRLFNGVSYKGCAVHQQGKMPCPAGLALKLELRNDRHPRPGVRHGRPTRIEHGRVLKASPANLEG